MIDKPDTSKRGFKDYQDKASQGIAIVYPEWRHHVQPQQNRGLNQAQNEPAEKEPQDQIKTTGTTDHQPG